MNISELLSNPSMIHAAIVHMPIAAAFIGLIFVILSAIFHRNNTVRALTALLFLIVAVSAYVAIESGEDARELVPNTLPDAVWTPLDAHAESAERVLYAGIFTLACLVLSLVRFDMIRIAALLLAAVGAIATNIFCANTGHLGGVLVYNHGVGTPLVHQAAPVLPVPTPEPVVEAPTSVMPPEAAAPPAPVEAAPAVPAPVGEPVPAPLGAEAVAVTDSAEWLPIRDFTPEEAALVSFKRDIWPVINEHCIDCHENPDADGEYDMTTVENMLKAGKKAGPAIVPGKPDESPVIQYVRGISKPQMPKKEDPLPPETLHTLRMWIAAGAKDDSLEPGAAPAPVEAIVEVPAPLEVPVEAAPAESTPPAEPAPVVVEPAPLPPVEAVPAPAEAPAQTAPAVEPVAPIEAPTA